MLQSNTSARCALSAALLLAALVLSACGGTAETAAPEPSAEPAVVTPAVPEDLRAITLTGGETLDWPCGVAFEEPGYCACGRNGGDATARVTVKGEVDCMTLGDYALEYRLSGMAGDALCVTRTVRVKPVPLPETAAREGVIYLTFDDGPCANTQELLDVLDKYGAKATFFVVASERNRYLEDMLPKIQAAGHAIGIHAANHDYDTLYSSSASYLADLASARQRVYELTGEYAQLCRFPGGSATAYHKLNNREDGAWDTVTAQLERMGMQYFDWNVSPENSVNSAASSVSTVAHYAPRYAVPVSLQHDTRLYSVKSVEPILQWGAENGYEFCALDASVPAVHAY